jgi:uncharacterized protein YukE
MDIQEVINQLKERNIGLEAEGKRRAQEAYNKEYAPWDAAIGENLRTIQTLESVLNNIDELKAGNVS